MSLEQYFTPYPNLKAAFWPRVDTIKWPSDKPAHALIALVTDKEKRSAGVASRTDRCCYLVAKHRPDWLKAKASTVLAEKKPENISATLGEIRAFGELLWVWDDAIKPGSSGHDFSFAQEGQKVRVEVFTLQHRTERGRIVHPPNEGKRISSQVIEIFPFGHPARPGKDNAQGEAVSKLAGMKQKEHQFSEADINILWCDLKDPALWMFGFGGNLFAPLSIFQEQIKSGAFWNAFYGRKGTPIFSGLPAAGFLSGKPYYMEFEGRFWQNTKLDFVIADTSEGQIILQNHKLNKIIPAWLLRDFHRLFSFDMQLSWIDWPCPGHLGQKVRMALDSIAKYETAFEPTDDA